MKISTLLMTACLVPLPVVAGVDAEQKGRAIAEQMEAQDTGWQDQKADMRMILRNTQGDESLRELRTLALEVPNDGDKTVSIFKSPRDIERTALLSFSHALSPDEQWLFLPALKRVKRIASANKSGPFVGSEFSYEDMTSAELEKYAYKWLRDESLEDRDTFVIERRPQYEHSGYTRQIAWIDKAMYQPLKIEFYDRKNALLKTLTLHEYEHHVNRYWRPRRMEMVNHQSRKSTTLHLANYEFRSGLSSRDFDRSRLRSVH